MLHEHFLIIIIIIFKLFFAIVNVLIQSGITYKYGKALAILCKLVMPINQ